MLKNTAGLPRPRQEDLVVDESHDHEEAKKDEGEKEKTELPAGEYTLIQEIYSICTVVTQV